MSCKRPINPIASANPDYSHFIEVTLLLLLDQLMFKIVDHSWDDAGDLNAVLTAKMAATFL
jgi:hypothetical protein